MKPHLCFIWGLVGLAAVVAAPMLLAAVTTTTYPPYPVTATNSYLPPNYSSSTSIGASASNTVIVALNAQALMLKEMLQEHQSRAAELTQKNQSERAKWEMELVNELQEKSQRVQKKIEEMAQPSAESLKIGIGGADDELVFVSMVEARLAQIQQELTAATADAGVLSVQIATNNTPEEIGRISSALGDNQGLVKELERERLDLELRKLEFRQIRKAMQR